MNKRINQDNKKTQEDILNFKKTLLNLSFQKFSGQLEKTSQIRKAKKEIARLKTKLSILFTISNPKMSKLLTKMIMNIQKAENI